MANVPDFRMRADRLSAEFEGIVKNYLFDELSASYIEKSGLGFLSGVPLPFTASDMVSFKNGGLDVGRLADNMAVMIGANTHFPHAGAYVKYFAKYFNEKLIGVLTGRATEKLLAKEYRAACVYFRAALYLDPEDKNAMFGYACCCREWYLSLEDTDNEALIAVLKSEASEYFEWTVIAFPDFAPAYYYLGYVYLNASLYGKAQFVWRKFVELAPDAHSPQCSEIKERLESLDEPVKIESGINAVLAGRYEDGLKILEPYVDSSYGSWWPLHFYLASAYRDLGFAAEAIEGFKKVLQLSPSHGESMLALADIYEQLGDEQMCEKYRKKYLIVTSDDRSCGDKE